MGDNVEIVQVLLDANSDVNAVENQSRGVNARGSPSYETPLDNAYSVYGAQDWEFGDKKAREKVFALLIAHGGKRGKDLKKQAPNKAGRRPQ